MKFYFILIFSITSLLVCAQQRYSLFEPKLKSSKLIENTTTTPTAQVEYLTINPTALESIKQQQPQSLSIELPFQNKTLVVNLNRRELLTHDFKLYGQKADGVDALDLPSILFYQGHLDSMGQSQGLATLAVFDGSVTGLISTRTSNVELNPLPSSAKIAQDYSIQNEPNVIRNFSCSIETPDENTPTSPLKQFTNSTPSSNPPNPKLARLESEEGVTVYIEADYSIFKEFKGGNIQATINFLLATMNNVAAVYNAEGITLKMSGLKIWQTPDPEALAGITTDTRSMLRSFSGRMNSINHNATVAHYLYGRGGGGGGRAYLLGGNLCTLGKDVRTGVSILVNDDAPAYPTNSWNAYLISHEIGHNLGANHTQWCGWPGGPIDGCVGPEGNCAPGPRPPQNGGTIMSYCNFAPDVGVNIANGFGPLPGAAIRATVAATCNPGSNCTTLTGDFNTDYHTQCISSNLVKLTFVPQGGIPPYTYSWKNGSTTSSIIDSLSKLTTYSLTLTDAQGCSLSTEYQGVTLSSSVNLSNSGTIIADIACSATPPIIGFSGKKWNQLDTPSTGDLPAPSNQQMPSVKFLNGSFYYWNLAAWKKLDKQPVEGVSISTSNLTPGFMTFQSGVFIGWTGTNWVQL